MTCGLVCSRTPGRPANSGMLRTVETPIGPNRGAYQKGYGVSAAEGILSISLLGVLSCCGYFGECLILNCPGRGADQSTKNYFIVQDYLDILGFVVVSLFGS